MAHLPRKLVYLCFHQYHIRRKAENAEVQQLLAPFTRPRDGVLAQKGTVNAIFPMEEGERFNSAVSEEG
jgi:hypothetical protein